MTPTLTLTLTLTPTLTLTLTPTPTQTQTLALTLTLAPEQVGFYMKSWACKNLESGPCVGLPNKNLNVAFTGK